MIEVSKDGGAVTITLDRAEKRNALTAAMLAQVAEAAEAARGAPVLILTGAGAVFSAGADLKEAAEGLTTDPVWERASGALAAFPGLTVAALNGTLAGGAFALALACDMRVAVPEAEFFYPVVQRGYLPQPSDPVRLAALVGPARARMLLVAGARIGAEEALRIGLVDRIGEDAVALAREVAAGALGAEAGHVSAIKGMFGATG